MRLIVQVSDNNGIAFNNRRQSRDREVIKDIMTLSEGTRIFADEYSKALFEGYDIIVDKEYLEIAGEDDYCFYEKGAIEEYMSKVNEIYVYKWNRDYPADEFFKPDSGFEMKESIEFQGYSHENITRERWIRK